MASATNSRLGWWSLAAPILAIVALALTWHRDLPVVVVVIVGVILIAAVLAAVHHAEVVALRVGEPLGSLILAVAVTVIEVALIVTLMLSDKPESASLARDTVFAALMITVNGIIGLSLFVGARRHGMANFNPEGTAAALATVTALAAMTLVIPNFTTTTPGPRFSASQLTFAAISSLALYVMFVFTQTVRHRDFFLPVDSAGEVVSADTHAEAPSNKQTLLSLGMLLVALVAVVGLAKVESPSIEEAVEWAGFPASFVGVVIALLVLLPETIAAFNAARHDRIQISLNLAFGSAMASIGLTIPVIAVAMIWLKGPLILGLSDVQMVLLALTVAVSILTVMPGRATRLQGGIHIVLLAAFIFLSIVP